MQSMTEASGFPPCRVVASDCSQSSVRLAYLIFCLYLNLQLPWTNKQACAAIGTTANVAAVHVHGLDYKAAAALVSVEFQSVATVTHMKYQLSHIHI